MNGPAIALVLAGLFATARGEESKAPTLSHEEPKVRATLQEAREKDLDPQITRLLDILRNGRDRRARLEAMRKLEGAVAKASTLDQGRIVAAFSWAIGSAEKDIQRQAILSSARVAENATERIEMENSWTGADLYTHPAYLVPERLSVGLAQWLRSHPGSAAPEADLRSEVLLAFARTGSRVRTPGGFQTDDVDVFLQTALEDIRLGVQTPGDTRKERAMVALDHYLTGSLASRVIPGAGGFLRRYKPAALDELARSLLEIAGAPVRNDFAPRAPASQTPDPDYNFRYKLIHTLIYLLNASDTADRRFALRSLLDRMYQDETHPDLKRLMKAHGLP